MTKRQPEFIPPYLFFGPERPPYPGGLGPYTDDVVVFRGYAISKRNKWSAIVEEWDCQHTALSAAGPGADCPDWIRDRSWTASVAGVTADGATMLEALEEAWAAADAEDQLRNLLPPIRPLAKCQ